MTSKASTFDTVVEMIEEFPAQVRWAIEHAPDDRLVDVLATINSTATQINVEKRRAASEVQDGDHGETWKVEQGRKGVRSFNTSNLVTKIGIQLGHVTSWETIRMLLFDKVIKIEWSWSNLEKLIRVHNLDLAVARHEIEDGDPEFDIGEFYVDGYKKYLPREEGKA